MIEGARSCGRHVDRLWIATFLLVTAIVVVRSWNAFAFPILEAEDGVRFVWCFEHDGLDLWTWRCAGYLSALPNAITALVSGAPLGMQPILYAACAGATASIALSLFAARRFRVVVRDDRVRSALCVMLAIAPHGNARLVASAMWMHFNFALMASLLACVPPPRSRSARAVEFGLIALLTTSCPLSLAAVPLRLAHAWRSPENRAYQLGLVGIAVLYVLFGLTPDPAGGRDPVILAGAFVRMLAQRVVAEALIGGAVWPCIGMAIWPFAAIVVVWAAIQVARLPSRMRRVALALTCVILAASALAVLGRKEMGMPDIWWSNRYTYGQRICFHLLLGVLVAHRCATATDRWRRIAIALGVTHALALALTSGEQYETSRRDGEAVLAWAAAAESWQHDPPQERASLGLRRVGGWDLQLR